ncbi:MAG: DUF1127 domain-containing protein [Parvibaculaceae bacterium]
MKNIVQRMMARRAFRRDLARQIEASPHLIRDIGMTMEEALAEIEKPFWQA